MFFIKFLDLGRNLKYIKEGTLMFYSVSRFLFFFSFLVPSTTEVASQGRGYSLLSSSYFFILLTSLMKKRNPHKSKEQIDKNSPTHVKIFVICMKSQIVMKRENERLKKPPIQTK